MVEQDSTKPKDSTKPSSSSSSSSAPSSRAAAASAKSGRGGGKRNAAGGERNGAGREQEARAGKLGELSVALDTLMDSGWGRYMTYADVCWRMGQVLGAGGGALLDAC